MTFIMSNEFSTKLPPGTKELEVMRVNSSSAGASALSGKPLIGGDELCYRRG
jgi:hypothetical protein